ncbi:MAG TPA: tetratricopeptide repeat protein [bacterium]|nr:tetratricopeptide repeat protein [bacterium]
MNCPSPRSIVVLTVLFFFISCATGDKKTVSDETKGDSYYQLGIAALNKGDLVKAKLQIIKAIELAPLVPYYHNHLGLVYLQEKDFDRAKAFFEAAHQLDNTYSDALNNLGILYLMKGDTTKAKEYFMLVLADQIYPYPHYAETNLGRASRLEKNYLEAEKHLLRALQIKGTHCDAYKELALMFDEQGLHDKSIENFKKTVEYCPRHVEALYRGAVKLLVLKDQATGTAWLRTCLEIERDNVTQIEIPFLRECTNLARQYGVSLKAAGDGKQQIEGGY